MGGPDVGGQYGQAGGEGPAEGNRIQDVAVLLAQRYELPLVQVRRILERTARYQCDTELADDQDVRRPCLNEPILWPSLPEACAHMSPVKALRLFETEDLTNLANEIACAGFLGEEWTPVCSLAEFAHLITRFIELQQRSRTELVRTGRPRATFRSCLFLDHLLGPLYPLRAESGRPGGRAHRPAQAAGDQLFDGNEWPRQPGHVGASLTMPPESPGIVLPEELRARVFDAKLAVLRMAAEALDAEKPKQLWPSCQEILLGSLSEPELRLLLRADSRDGKHGRSQGQKALPSGRGQGGLSSTIDFIGHCEQELNVGLYCRSRERLSPLLRLFPFHQPRLDTDYYGALDTSNQPILQDGIRLFLELAPISAHYLEHYACRVNDRLLPRYLALSVEATLPSIELVHGYMAMILKFVEYVKWYMKTHGRQIGRASCRERV